MLLMTGGRGTPTVDCCPYLFPLILCGQAGFLRSLLGRLGVKLLLLVGNVGDKVRMRLTGGGGTAASQGVRQVLMPARLSNASAPSAVFLRSSTSGSSYIRNEQLKETPPP
ncbi:unnamed protein product [Nesidiocoris tenuis]|uniref:Uncharacterized protein n=1 Tax=Nesidiocoris tenuis TaxID=355587 RepID=A0A6H5HIR4_9HEMI|nr:unnamed protein product [Nesidiocoris tenuis]